MGGAARILAAIALTIAVLTASACKSAPASAIAGTPDTAQDAKLTAFLQKHFRIPEADYLKLGPPVPAPIPGLWSRSVTASNGQGASATSTIFINEAGDKFIFGQFLDLNEDPWGRVNVDALHLDDRPTMGPADAPVTMVEFADFECPHCARALPKVEAAVHNHEGRVRLVYKYFPLAGHTWARAAAIASECARIAKSRGVLGFRGCLLPRSGLDRCQQSRGAYRRSERGAQTRHLDSARLPARQSRRRTRRSGPQGR